MRRSIYQAMYRGMIGKLVLLLVMTAVALLSLTVATGLLRYDQQLEQVTARLQTADMLYLMRRVTGEELGDRALTLQTAEQIAQIDGVREVVPLRTLQVRMEGIPYTVVVYDRVLAQFFTPQGISGELPVGEEEIVIPGYGIGRRTHVTLTPTARGREQETYQMKVVGRFGPGSYLPRLTHSSVSYAWESGESVSKQSLQSLLKAAGGHTGGAMMLVSDASALYGALREETSVDPHLLILLQASLTAEERRTLMEALGAWGTVADMTELANSTAVESRQNAAVTQYLLAFCAMILVMTLGISLSILRQRQPVLTVYALCGCTGTTQTWLSTVGVASVAVAACAVQVLAVLFWYDLRLYGSDYTEHAVVDGYSLLASVIYIILIGGIAVLSAVMSRRKTPSDRTREELR